MAEIRVAPQRRTRTVLVVTLITIAVVAAVVWYFLMGPGAAATGGA
jgi:hypothetical protein